ncbi:MAG: DUF5684 domain-containing protein [Rikenellaceae bacterium]|nr:DUF5684 domain-containing protein [Rikenellaceae bacterium]
MYSYNPVFFTVYAIIWFVVVVILVISNWKLFEKAGEKGWKALIPFYNFYIFIKISGRKEYYFWVILAGMILMPVLNYFNMSQLQASMEYGAYPANPFMLGLLSLFGLAVAVTMLVFSISVLLSICDRFGVSRWFTVGLVLLPIIFMPVLAFGDYRYTPPVSNFDSPESTRPESL